MFENFFSVFSAISIVLLVLLFIKIVVFIGFSSIHFRKEKGIRNPITRCVKASILVPAYNEELTLMNCIDSLAKQTYSNYEILIINDGSTDNTLNVAKTCQKKYPNLVKVLNKPNGGKAAALNFGLTKSTGEIIISIDADSMFLPATTKKLVHSFADKAVAAVGGNVKISNRNKLLTMHQEIEYISGLNIQRRCFSQMNCVQVISGAIGAFRKTTLLEIGGYSTDTIVEDRDVTISLARKGYKILFRGDALAYTEAPEKLSFFLNQRKRWVFGGFQVLLKHKDVLFRKKYGSLGMVGLPYFLIFPWIDVLISLIFFITILRAFFIGSFVDLVFFYLAMAFVQFLIISYALHLDKEKRHKALIAMMNSLWYSHLISFVTIKAGISFLLKQKMSWNRFARKGKNILPQ